jgi:hypothetical protein
MQKLGDNVLAKHIAGASLRESESLHIDFGV